MATYCSVRWDFNESELNDVQMDITVHEDLPPFPEMYLQTYDFSMFTQRSEFNGKGIYSYSGLQSNVRDDINHSWRGKGILFSRFETLNPADLRVEPGGWHEIPDSKKIAAEGGIFVGVRNSFNWGKGQYRMKLFPEDEDEVDLWYCFKVQDLNNGTECRCGSLRFPKFDGKRPGIPNFGTTFLEIYPQSYNPALYPFWHISVNNIKANQEQLLAKRAIVTYNDDQVPTKNSDVSLSIGTKNIEIKVGNGVIRKTPNGTVFLI